MKEILLRKLFKPNIPNVMDFNHLRLVLDNNCDSIKILKIRSISNPLKELDLLLYYSLSEHEKREGNKIFCAVEFPNKDGELLLNRDRLPYNYLELIPFCKGTENEIKLTVQLHYHYDGQNKYIKCSLSDRRDKELNMAEFISNIQVETTDESRREKTLKLRLNSNPLDDSVFRLFSKDNYEDEKKISKDLNEELTKVINEKSFNIKSVMKLKQAVRENVQIVLDNLKIVQDNYQRALIKEEPQMSQEIKDLFKLHEKYFQEIKDNQYDLLENVEQVRLGVQEVSEIVKQNKKNLEKLAQDKTLPRLIAVYKATGKDEDLIKKAIDHFFLQKLSKNFIVFEFECDYCNTTYKFLLLEQKKMMKVLRIAVKFVPIAKKFVNDIGSVSLLNTNQRDDLLDFAKEVIQITTPSKGPVNLNSLNELKLTPREVQDLYGVLQCFSDEMYPTLIDVFEYIDGIHVCRKCLKDYRKDREQPKSFQGKKIPRFEAKLLEQIEEECDYIDISPEEPRYPAPYFLYFTVAEGRVREIKLNFAWLPTSIGNFKALESLKLNHAALKYLPDSIGDLKSLKILDLEGNDIKSLPDSIGDLTSLETLNLSENTLDTLPESIGKLTSLKQLYLKGNQLSHLPGSISNLQSLSVLDLSSNKFSSHLDRKKIRSNKIITDLPDSLSELTSLKKLYLDGNYLKILPEMITHLPSLTDLILSNNQLSTLPEALANFSSLSALYLGGNSFSSLPEPILKLPSLKALDLSHNNFEILPDTLKKLKNLEILYIYNNPLNRLPGWLVDLPSLENLTISKDQGYSEDFLEELEGKISVDFIEDIIEDLESEAEFPF